MRRGHPWGQRGPQEERFGAVCGQQRDATAALETEAPKGEEQHPLCAQGAELPVSPSCSSIIYTLPPRPASTGKRHPQGLGEGAGAKLDAPRAEVSLQEAGGGVQGSLSNRTLRPRGAERGPQPLGVPSRGFGAGCWGWGA